MATRIETIQRDLAATKRELRLLKAVVNEVVSQLNTTMPVLIAKIGADVPTLAIPETAQPPIESSLIQIVRG